MQGTEPKIFSRFHSVACDVASYLRAFFKNYPTITDPHELCVYYRSVNRAFPSYFAVLTGFMVAIEMMCFVMYLFNPLKWPHLGKILLIWLALDLPFAICTWYCFQVASAPRPQKDIAYQSWTHIKLQTCVLMPTVAFSLLPLAFSHFPEPAQLAASSWQFSFVAQLNVCAWLADGIAYKVFLMGLLNVGFYAICTVQGYMDCSLPKFAAPFVLAIFFFVTLDWHTKENFILHRELRRQKKMYESHLLKVRDPVAIVGDRQIEFANEAARQIFGSTPDEFARAAEKFVSEGGETLISDIRGRIRREDSANSSAVEPVQQERYFVCEAKADSATYKRTFNVSLVGSSFYRRSRLVSFALHDITDELLREEARVESKYKNMLFFSLSHELRTPLNIFQVFLATARANMRTPEAMDTYRAAKGAWRYLRNKISDILDYAQILAEEFVLHRGRFSLRRFVSQLRKSTDHLLGQQKRSAVRLQFVVSRGIPDEIVEDKDRLEQVLFNLLSNATKYTVAGTISLYIYRSSTEVGKIVFEVADTGCGMAPESMGVLFNLRSSCEPPLLSSVCIHSVRSPSTAAMIASQRDLAASSAQSRRGSLGAQALPKSSGLSGLGLTISKMICNRMGTDIKVRSTLGKGSAFSFAVPSTGTAMTEPAGIRGMPRSTEGTIPDETAAVHTINRYDDFVVRCPASVAGRVGVLIVDDSEMSRFAVKNMIRKFGFRVEEADTGTTAIEKLGMLQEAMPESSLVMFMDLEMPRMDGVAATREIRRQDKTPKPYIIALTAFGSENERARCIQAGMNGFMSKPLTKEAVTDLFSNLGLI